MNSKKTFVFSGLGLFAALVMSCEPPMIDQPSDPLELPQQERGPDYGFNHDDILDNPGDIFKDGRQVSPAEGEKLHSCGKLRFETFSRVVGSRGINLNNPDPNGAGTLIKRAEPVWGVANFIGRIPEATRNTTSSLVSLQDIALAMADELVTMPNSEGSFTSGACMGEKLFTGTACNRDGFACLLGVTPSPRQLDLCNLMVVDASTGVTDELTRKRLTVAALVGVTYLCD